MHILITWGSKLGGTAGIAELIGDELTNEGHDVVLAPAEHAPAPSGFDAVIVGGALYANRWHRAARRFVMQHLAELRRVPVWLFSSGPLDDSAEREELAPPPQVAVLAERVGAIAHHTFGGRLDEHVKGFPAQAMAKTTHGDWRNPERIRAWAGELARQLPTARPRPAIEPTARAPGRVVAHAAAAWLVSALVLVALLPISTTLALVAHLIATPIVFVVAANHYFRVRGSREPIGTAAVMTAIAAVLQVALAIAVLGSAASLWAVWLPIALAFGATAATGFLRSTMPWPKARPGQPAHAA